MIEIGERDDVVDDTMSNEEDNIDRFEGDRDTEIEFPATAAVTEEPNDHSQHRHLNFDIPVATHVDGKRSDFLQYTEWSPLTESHSESNSSLAFDNNNNRHHHRKSKISLANDANITLNFDDEKALERNDGNAAGSGSDRKHRLHSLQRGNVHFDIDGNGDGDMDHAIKPHFTKNDANIIINSDTPFHGHSSYDDGLAAAVAVAADPLSENPNSSPNDKLPVSDRIPTTKHDSHGHAHTATNHSKHHSNRLESTKCIKCMQYSENDRMIVLDDVLGESLVLPTPPISIQSNGIHNTKHNEALAVTKSTPIIHSTKASFSQSDNLTNSINDSNHNQTTSDVTNATNTKLTKGEIIYACKLIFCLLFVPDHEVYILVHREFYVAI